MAAEPLSLGPVTAKLARPPATGAVLRAETLDAYRQALRRRLTVVCAPAGYGKSTATAAATERLEADCVWYKLDLLDRDPVLFLASLTEAFRRRVPAFGEAIRERLRSAGTDPFPVAHMQVMFVRECEEHLGATVHIVLDDYHEAVESAATNRTLDYLLANLPPSLHFVVISRYDPAIHIAKMRLNDEVSVLDANVLRFNVVQAVEVLTVRTGIEPAADLVARLVETAEGWPASIVLAGLALDWIAPASVEATLSDPRLKQDIYSYLAEQVYMRETRAIRRFLKRTCCLEHITVELAARVAHTEAAHRHLRHLATNRVFTFTAGEDGAYRYHNLFRDFLRQKLLQDEGQAAFHRVQRETAAALEDAGETAMAVELFLSANEPAEALRVVARVGEALLDDVPSDRLASWVDRLPPALRIGQAWPRLMEAQLDSRAGDYGRALHAIDDATKLFGEAGDRRGLYEAYSMRECALFWRGDTGAAIAACQQALVHAQTDQQRFHTLLSLGSAAVESRDWTLAEQAFDEADKLAVHTAPRERPRAQALRAHALFFQGSIRQAKDSMPSLDSLYVSPSLRVAATNTLGMIETGLAAYDSALRTLNGAITLARKYGFALPRDMILDNIGLAEGSLGRFDKGLDYVRMTARAHAVEDQPGLHAWAHCHEATLLRRSGRIDAALQAADHAVSQAAALDDAYARLNFEANLLFTRGLLGEDSFAGLDAVAKRATDARVAFVALKSNLYGAILDERNGRARECRDRLCACVPRQLHLGHLHVLAQELCPRPGMAIAALDVAAELGLEQSLMDALATHWRFADLAGVILAEHPRFAHVAIHAARARATDDVLAGVLAAADGSSSPEVDAAADAAVAARPGISEMIASPLADLSPRELEVLGLMADGLRNGEIAATLFIVEGTVKTHVNHILTKLAVSTRIQAILVCRDALTQRHS